ncbi:MAG TPA: sigma 54-interacting transcriptional regulator [Kofleriaceae bacterium]
MSRVVDGADQDLELRTCTSAGAALRVRQLVPVFAPGRELPAAIALDAGPVQIGRRGYARIALDDDEVSRRHAELAYDAAAERWLVRDIGSLNGTWVDGARIDRAALAHGAVVRIGQTLLVMVDVALPAGQRLRRESSALRGHSVAMQRLRGEIALMAEQPMPLLVLGEPGLDRTLVARELHDGSGRSGPFVPVSCGAVPRTLAEGERLGPLGELLAEAHGGTLFLDEVCDLPEVMQDELLCAPARSTGHPPAPSADVRVIAATHRALAPEATGGLRVELYERLDGRVLRVPPLRDRRDDILDLARGVLDQHRGGRVALSCRAAEALLLYDWPLNAHELERVLESAAVRAVDGVIRCWHLPPAIATAPPAAPSSIGSLLHSALRAGPRAAEAAEAPAPSEASGDPAADRG